MTTHKEYSDIYKKYFDNLYYMALGYVHNKAIAQDKVQDAFRILFENISKVPVEKYLSYLHSTVKNLCLDHIRETQKLNIVENEFLEKELLNEDISELIEEARKKFNTLPPQCQKVFILSYVEGLTYKEISENQGISINTVKHHITTANKKLKDLALNNYAILFIFL